MEVSVSLNNNLVIFDFVPSEEDLKIQFPISLKNRSCLFELPISVNENDIHPDLLAFSVLLCAYPFTKNELKLHFTISEEFANEMEKYTGLKLICKRDKGIKLRTIKDGRPGLSYSGGMDSTASLALMPKNTFVGFLNRIQPSFQNTLYDKVAPLNALKDVANLGYEVYDFPSNLEYLRNPIGFTVDQINTQITLAASIPMILLSDHYKLDAIAFGNIQESLYMTGYKKYEDYKESEHYKRWSPLFKKINLELFMSVAGLTEIGTSIVTTNFSSSKWHRSCMRGDENNSCGKCIKCFRKLTLDKSTLKDSVDYEKLIINLNSVEVLKNIYGDIKTLENVYRYIVNNLQSNPLIDSLKNRINIIEEDTTWMERWYPKSLSLIPLKYQEDYKLKVLSYIDIMTEKDIKFVEEWDVNLYPRDNKYMLEWQSFVKNLITDPNVLKYLNTLTQEININTSKTQIDFSTWISK